MSALGLTLSVTLIVVLAMMTALWGLSLRRRDAGIVDPFWGAGFVLVAWLSRGLNAATDWRSLTLIALTTVWGVRLSLFLLSRNLGHNEDHRYAAMRQHHGPRFWWYSLFSVFLLQGFILWFVAWPIQVSLAQSTAEGFGWLDGIGIIIWSTGLLFESVGDWQLARFKADPANSGRVLDKGLWRYTRHPNYFGDCCVWWGLYLLAAGGGAWWTIGSPVLMTVLLLKVSGVSLLESSIVDRRPEYGAYQARTSSFFPWPPSVKK